MLRSQSVRLGACVSDGTIRSPALYHTLFHYSQLWPDLRCCFMLHIPAILVLFLSSLTAVTIKHIHTGELYLFWRAQIVHSFHLPFY